MPTPLIAVLQTAAFTLRHRPALAPRDGIEPPFPRSERGVLPLNDRGIGLGRVLRPLASAFQARCSSCTSFTQMERTGGFEPPFSTPITVRRFATGVGYVRMEPPAGFDPASPG